VDLILKYMLDISLFFIFLRVTPNAWFGYASLLNRGLCGLPLGKVSFLVLGR
jgi:hypothetical protein